MKMLDEIIKRVHNLTHDQQKKVLKNLQSLQEGQQREYPRLSIKMDVDAVICDKIIQTEARNLSASGVYINTSGRFEIDEQVRVVFTVPGYESPFKLYGKIARIEQEGIAIKFEKMTLYHKKILDDAIWEVESKK